MDEHFTQLPKDILSASQKSPADASSNNPPSREKVLSRFEKHPRLIFSGVIATGIIFVGISAYFLYTKTQAEKNKIENLVPVAALDNQKDAPTLLSEMQKINPAIEENQVNDVPTADAAQEESASQMPPENENNTLDPDIEPPNSSMYFPEENGTILEKIDNQVCVTANLPTDNISPSEEIAFWYRFDEEEWQAVTKPYNICKEELVNGAHTFQYKSQDMAGNMEEEKTLSFLVQIDGN